MPIFTDGARMAPQQGPDLGDLGVSTSEMLGATAREAVSEFPTVRALDIRALNQASSTEEDLGSQIARIQGGEDLADVVGKPKKPTDLVSIGDARAQLKEHGVDKGLTLPNQPEIRQAALDIMISRAKERREREATIARGPGGVVPSALAVGTSFLVGAVDPLNLASAFIPVVGELRYAKLLADAGESVAARAGVRAGVGAAEGAVGQAALEPIHATATLQEGQDYTMAHALRSVIFGAALGAGLRTGGGAIADVVRTRGERPLYPYDVGEPLEYHTPFSEVALPRPAPVMPGEEAPNLPERYPGAPSNEGAKSVATPPDPHQAVFDDALTQLRVAGMNEDEAAQNAAVVAARYAARADRLGRGDNAFDLYHGEGLAVSHPGDHVPAEGLTFDQARRRGGERDLFAEREAEGQQNLPGTERIGQGELAQRRADEPLKPKAEQKPMDVGLFSDDAKQKSFFQSQPAPPFYSAVSRAIDSTKLEKAAPAQWLGTLKNTPGVKPEELQWLGLEDWLKGHDGPVSKQAIADYVRANQIEVKEVAKGAPPQGSKVSALQDFQGRMIEKYDGLTKFWLRGTPEELEQWDRLSTDAHGSIDNEKYGATKFGQYTLPGGENYRELLLTLPSREAEIERPAPIASLPEGYRVIHYSGDGPLREWGIIPPDQLHAGAMGGRQYPTEAEAIAGAIDQLNYQQNARHNDQVRDAQHGLNFTNSHWDEPNVLAHVRFNDRTIDGKRALFLEEIQSDWHQAGKRKGYRGAQEAELAKLVKQRDELATEWEQLAETIKRANDTPLAQITESDLKGSEAAVARQGRLTDEMNALHDRIREIGIADVGVLDAPFKTTWPELALKRMIRYAAENGYDKIAWTDGATQAERYDLSKHIQAVRWNEKTGDFQAKDHDGKVVIRRQATAEELPDLIGKEASDRLLHKDPETIQELSHVKQADLSVRQTELQYIVRNVDGREVPIGKGTVGSEAEALEYAERYFNRSADEINQKRQLAGEDLGPRRELSGLDLKVGGEGMAGFYDKILPAAANKLTKKFGGKVERGDLPGTGQLSARYEGPEPTAAQIAEVERASNAPPRQRVFESPITGERQELQINRVANSSAIRDVQARMQSDGLSFREAMAIDGHQHLADIFGGRIEQFREPAPGKPVHTLDITPALREAAVGEGFPLFQRGGEGEPRGRITIADNRAVVELFKNADQSTFMHEMGHKWLDELASDAAGENVPQALKDDLGTVLRWLGVDKAEDIGVPQHEQWARGFEQYLREGSAPSSALARAFEAFKSWLQSIYRNLTQLGTPITDDVRGVMDRMLASDRELAEWAPARGALEILSDLPPRAKEDAMRAATAALVSGEPVRVGEMIDAAAKVDPRIAESVAKGEPNEADIVTTHVRAKPPRGPRARDPDTWSLLEFIASRGGIDPTDPLIGDVRGLTGGVRKFIPGFGDLVRKGGLRLDAMREAAVEAGYIHDIGFIERNSQATSTISTLLEAMDSEMRGKRVYKYDRAPDREPTKAEMAEREEEEQRHWDSQVIGGLREEGIDALALPDKTFDRVLEIMRREGESDALAAYERAVMEETYYGAEAGQHQRIADHIPGWDRVPDEPGPAPAPGGAPAAVGQPGAGGAARPAGGGDRAALERDAWRELSRPVAEDGEALAASRAADKLPEPPSTVPDKRLQAAEKAAADAEAAYLDAEPYLPPDLRQRIADELVQHDEDLVAQTEVIRRGGACLAAAID